MTVFNSETIQAALLRSTDDLKEETGCPALVLDVDSVSSLEQDLLDKVEHWSKKLPCPVIGVGSSDSKSIAHCVDTVVERAELGAMMRRIKANPQAATVLVQVLRAIEHLPPADALVVESLAYATLQSGEEFKRWLNQYQAQKQKRPLKDSGPPVIITRREEQLSVVLNRPENDNAYTAEMRDALTEAFNLVNLDDSIINVSVTAAGRCFCTGGELTEFGTVSSPAIGHLIRSQLSPAKLILSSPERYHFHVHKACVGSGIEIPACAGQLTASPKTLFWLPELSMGLIPGAGGCVSISRRIGRHRTAYLVLMNKKIDAKKALEWGLIDGITGDKKEKDQV